jgi:hypothetical protein
VVTFYGNARNIQSAAKNAANQQGLVTADELDHLAELLKEAFRDNARPLLDELPRHADNAKLREDIEAIAPSPQRRPWWRRLTG